MGSGLPGPCEDQLLRDRHIAVQDRVTACPAHLAVQGYIKMAAEGRYLDALKLIKQDNPFPAVCGAICNRRCEDACTRGTVDQAVAIDEIKKFIAEQELHEEHRYVPLCENHEGKQFEQKIAVSEDEGLPGDRF